MASPCLGRRVLRVLLSATSVLSRKCVAIPGLWVRASALTYAIENKGSLAPEAAVIYGAKFRDSTLAKLRSLTQ